MRSFAFAPVCILVAACSAPANPPSLLPRAIEGRRDAAPVAPIVTAPKGIAPALAARINALFVEAKGGDAEFARTQSTGDSALSSGRNAPAGSESWIAAQLVLSALQVARQRSAGALAEIDALAVNQGELTSRDATIGGLSEILAVQAEIEAIVARQSAKLEAVSR